MIGKKIGRLLVLEKDVARSINKRRFYWCICECGTKKSINSACLYGPSPNTRSCGCLNFEKICERKENLIGRVFSYYTVIDKDPTPPSKKIRAKWICKCVCGNIRSVDTYSLTSGSSKGCGCYSSVATSARNRKYPGNVAKNNIIARYKKEARYRGKALSLTREQMSNLFESNCHYCGVKPSSLSKSRHEEFYYNGIDRVDNDKGYFIDNCVPCCNKCNITKRDRPLSEFMEWIDGMVSFRNNISNKYEDYSI